MIKTYTYYFRLRPPSIGTHPKGFINLNTDSITINNRQYWGTVTYNRELTRQELFDYDLDPKPIKRTKKELKQLYHDYLFNLFNGNEDEILTYIDDVEGYQEFINQL